jgi:hypothetical protein
MASATITLLTGIPEGGVCLVIKRWPIIEVTKSATFEGSLVR